MVKKLAVFILLQAASQVACARDLPPQDQRGQARII